MHCVPLQNNLSVPFAEDKLTAAAFGLDRNRSSFDGRNFVAYLKMALKGRHNPNPCFWPHVWCDDAEHHDDEVHMFNTD